MLIYKYIPQLLHSNWGTLNQLNPFYNEFSSAKLQKISVTYKHKLHFNQMYKEVNPDGLYIYKCKGTNLFRYIQISYRVYINILVYLTLYFRVFEFKCVLLHKGVNRWRQTIF